MTQSVLKIILYGFDLLGNIAVLKKGVLLHHDVGLIASSRY